MIFRLWSMGKTQRVYINDLDCLEGTEEKAYVKPLPMAKRKGEDKEAGVELVVTNEELRPVIEEALSKYGLLPEGTLETGHFSLYKWIAEKHRFTGGSLIR